MNYYQHHIGDFNNATRYCTRLERAIYRDCLDLYYDKEAPLPGDLDRLSRLLQVRTDEEGTGLQAVLTDFFTKEADGYHNARCNAEIEKYHGFISKQSLAGKASARARRKKAAVVEPVLNGGGASVEPPINQEPLSNNDTKTTSPVPSTEAIDPVVIGMPTNRFNTEDEEFLVTESMVTEWQEAYPSLNIAAELSQARVWLLDNQEKRKTVKGMRSFIGSWLQRNHDQGATPVSATVHQLLNGSTRDRTLEQDLTDTSWPD